MAEIDILRAELQDDPLGVGYAELEDAVVAASLNEVNRPGKREVVASDVRMYVLLHGLWPTITAVAATSTNPVHKGTAMTILQTLGAGSFDVIRMNNPAIAAGVGQMLATMVEAGAISETNRAEMVAMGDTQVSRARELGLGTVHHMTVAEARRGTI